MIECVKSLVIDFEHAQRFVGNGGVNDACPIDGCEIAHAAQKPACNARRPA